MERALRLVRMLWGVLLFLGMFFKILCSRDLMCGDDARRRVWRNLAMHVFFLLTWHTTPGVSVAVPGYPTHGRFIDPVSGTGRLPKTGYRRL